MFALRTRYVATALALLVGSVTASAQTGTITGRVTESETGLAILGARVRALSGATTAGATVSGEDGTYSIGNLAAGSYTLEVTRIGFAPGTTSVSVTSGGTATANVQLSARVIELNPVVTSVSRKEEKALDAPAAVSVIDVRQVEEQVAPTVADQLQGMAGVDVSKGGMVQSNIVTRGFNNAFSGSMLVLQDYRFAGVPSLRVNVPFLFTGTNEDVERIEVLLGPASALYGPNSADGVLNIITKSPFESQGTTLTIDAGERSLFRGAFRTARTFGDKLGIKLSGESFTANDWHYTDPGEPAQIMRPAAGGGYALVNNTRDYTDSRTTGEARMDIHPRDDAELITTFGYTRIGSAIELTGANGAAQARNWTYKNLQQRVRFGRFFAQAFVNYNNSGNRDSLDASGTYLLRSGQPIVDKSWVAVGQVQHGHRFGDRQDFVYGVDYIRTTPRTGGTINGRNENNDDVTEVGAYVQSTTNLTPNWDFVAALRDDQNNLISGSQVSPRAALIFKPTPTQNFRFTYNRAFSTPQNFSWFLDLIQAHNIQGSPFDVRAVGNPPKQGWQFNRTCDAGINDGLCMKSPFLGSQANDFVPSSAALALPGLVAAQSTALTAAFTPQIEALLISQGVPTTTAAQQAPVLAGQLVTYLGSLQPTAQQVGTHLARLGDQTNPIDAASVTDIGPLHASYNTTFELGYKGIIGNRLRMAINVWREKRGDVATPADLVTPAVYVDSASYATYLTAALTPALQQYGLSQPVAAAAAGTIGKSVADAFKIAPLGVVTFNNPTFATPTDFYATYFVVNQSAQVTGADLAVDYVANDQWTLGMTYSWVNHTIFPNVISSNSKSLMLNAPDNKGSVSVQYRNERRGWSGNLRLRYFDKYPVNSGVFATGVDFLNPSTTGTYRYPDLKATTLLDVGLSYRLPFAGGRSAMLSVSADNLLNDLYRTFPGTPEQGRLVMSRLQLAF